MHSVSRHFTRALLAGIIALLPIGGTIFSIVWMEVTISESWLARQAWYFPGMGIVVVALVIYLIGVTVTTFLGRWFWNALDRLLDRLPALGGLYRTLKQIVGYGEGKEGALFTGVVLVPSHDATRAGPSPAPASTDVRSASAAVEIGLVTHERIDARGVRRLTIFLPHAPMPTAGRLIIIDADQVQPVNMPVNEALKTLISMGKSGTPECN